jgi:hypothetical protein
MPQQPDDRRPPAPQDEELNAVLRRLVDSGALDATARGITRQVLARGEGTLSERQEYVFNTQVRAKYIHRACRLCEDLIPLAEVTAAWANGDLCASCARILGPTEGEAG